MPDDRRYAEQWGPGGIGADYAWSIERGESSVIIAVIDTGVDYTHPDMGNYITGGYDWINNDDDPMDDHGHGTHCAGIAAAVSNNALGVVDFAVRHYGGEGADFMSGTSSLTAAALRRRQRSGRHQHEPGCRTIPYRRRARRYAWEKAYPRCSLGERRSEPDQLPGGV